MKDLILVLFLNTANQQYEPFDFTRSVSNKNVYFSLLQAGKTSSTLEVRGTDGWDTEEWASLEEEPEV